MSNPGLTNLAAYWNMDEIGGTRYDSVSNNHLTDTNTCGSDRGRRVISADFVAANEETLGIASNAEINPYGNVSFTIGCWVKLHTIAGTPHIYSKWQTDPVERQFVMWMNGARAGFSVHDGTTQYTAYADNFGTLNPNWWYFICAFYDADSDIIAIGVNDVWNQVAGPSAGIDNTNRSLFFGSEEQSSKYYDGLIDEAFLYIGRWLNSAERTWMYNEHWGRTYTDIVSAPPPSVEIVISPPTVPVLVLDSTLTPIGMIDDYYSLIWAERYSEAGDFELELPIKYQSDPLITFGNFLYTNISDKPMLIEDIKPMFGEDKISLLVSGESAESMLKRRIVEGVQNIAGRSEIMIYDLIRFHITEPEDTDREISLFKTDFPAMLTTPVYNDQFENQTLYEITKVICRNTGLGFKIIIYDGELVFLIYEGLDHSDEQSENDLVVFSETFDNVISSSYYSSERDKVTVVLVVTDDSVYPSVYVWAAGASEPTGSDRHEIVLETTIDRDVEDPPLTDAEVLSIILQKGRELINEVPVGIFEGNFNIQGSFKYGVDFFMGDLVQCILSGKEVKARVIEVVHSYSAEGRKAYVAMDFMV